MSLVAVYDALKSANVPDDKAVSAVETLEKRFDDSQDEAWKRGIETELASIKTALASIKAEHAVYFKVIIALIFVIGAPILIKTFWG